MSFIDSEDEINYELQDIDNMCQKKEEFNIDDLLAQEEQKEDKEEIIEDIIYDMDLGKDILYKFELSSKKSTPVKFILTDKEGKYFSLFEKLRNEEDIIPAFNKYNKEYNINIQDFLLAYFLANKENKEEFIINNINILKNISNIELDEDNYESEKNKFLLKAEFLYKKTLTDYEKIKNFYKELSTLSYTTSPEKLASSLKLKETGIIIKVTDGDYDFNVDSGAIIFNNMQVSDNFPFIHYRDVEENFYKIHEDIDKEELVRTNHLIDTIRKDDIKKYEHYIFVSMKISLVNKEKYILLEFDLKEETLKFKYPGNSLPAIKKKLPDLLPDIRLKKEKLLETKGSFELIFPNYNNTRLYFLTFFDKIITNFLYVKEFNKPRSLVSEYDKFYFKTYTESKGLSDYSASFFIEPLYGDFYSINFSSKIINNNTINEFALIMSKLAWYYNNMSKELDDLFDIVVQPYTGPNGAGLGAPISEKVTRTVTFKSRKLDNLFDKAPEIFPKNEYSRLCGCPKQPIIVDDEDVEDWKKYSWGGKDHEVLKFPPLDSEQSGKRYNFVCPTENNVLSFIPNPDYKSDYPILPCCTAQKKSGLYKNYETIRAEGTGKTIGEKKQSKSTQLKTVKLLNYQQTGFLPEEIQDLLKSVHPNNKFSRYGINKVSNKSFLMAVLVASSHLNEIKKYSKNEEINKKLDVLIKIREKFMNTDSEANKIVIIDSLINKLDKVVNISSALQENYNLSETKILKKIKNNSEIFDSYYYYKLLENIFHLNIFVFVYQNDQVVIERPNHRFFHIREINLELPSVLLFKNVSKRNFPIFELITSDAPVKNTKTPLLFTDIITKMMKKNIENQAYYICESHREEDYTVRKNYYQNVNWNYILCDYKLVGQAINDSGRVYRINIMVDEEEISLYIPPSFPLDLPISETIFCSNSALVKELFDGKAMTGSQGLWFNMNGCRKAVFVPCNDIDENDNKCNVYEIERTRKENDSNFFHLNTINRNANIIKQLFLWCWNLSKINDVDEWFDKYVIISDEREENRSFNFNPISIDYRFPNNIENTTDGINYLSYYVPLIFSKNHIYLYDKLYIAMKQFLKNYNLSTKGFAKIPNKAIINAFVNEKDFKEQEKTRIIVGERNWNEWINFIITGNKITIELGNEDSDKIRPFLYKDIDGHIFLIQNTIESNLSIALLISKIWNSTKINLGYYSTDTNIWRCLEKDRRLLLTAGMDSQDIIAKANELSDEPIKNFCDAINFLDKEDISYEDKRDCHYFVYHQDGTIRKEGDCKKEKNYIWHYDNGKYASMLPII